MGDAPFLTIPPDEEKKNLAPIYKALTKPTASARGNLTCSGSREFCFLCSYSSTSDCEVDLRAHIDELVGTGLEVKTIAKAVYEIYNEHLRDTVVFERHDGVAVRGPEWSIESIRRHLLLSPEYDEVFSTYQDFLFKSIILRQADRIVSEDGDVDSDSTKALLSTIKHYSDFRCKAAPAAKRARKNPNEVPS
jgi:hypothetical protein